MGSGEKKIKKAKKQSNEVAAMASSDHKRPEYANERTSEDVDEKLKRGPDGAD